MNRSDNGDEVDEFESALGRALRDEAYRHPMQLQAHELRMRIGRSQRRYRMTTFASVASVAALLAVIGVSWASIPRTSPDDSAAGMTPASGTMAAAPTSQAPQPSSHRQPSASAPASSLFLLLNDAVRNGDSVMAEGYVVEAPGFAPRLCYFDVVGWRGDDQTPQCPSRKIVLEGVSGRVWPGWRQHGLGGISSRTIVHGTWHDGTIVVNDAESADPPGSRLRPTSPCSEPTGGWPGPPPQEASVRAVEQEVHERPELYSGYYSATMGTVLESAEVTADELVLVVGTLGNLDIVRDQLSAIYPYNLCVVSAEFSASDLQNVVDRLSEADSTWHAHVDVPTDRVVLELVALDEQAVRTIGADARKVTLDALVQRKLSP